MSSRRLILVRVIALAVVAFGLTYIAWRWSSTIAWGAWWIAVPLALAETYSLSESILYSLTMWNSKRRPAPPPATPGRTVDVFITTYNEPLELVMKTALAARNMTYPHRTWILDDGNRTEFRHAAAAAGVGYIVRGEEWDGRPRFAKAGNVNNALSRTDGDFIAILDADQMPEPQFLDRVLGYFEDESVALVQTPQKFWNVGKGDPLGSEAELFYGPIQQGKDGWDAAFFCGSNAVLRREALMSLGLSRYARAAAGRTRQSLRHARGRLANLMNESGMREPALVPLLEEAQAAIVRAEAMLRQGVVLTEVTYALRQDFQGIIQGAPEPALELIPELDEIVEEVDVSRTDQAIAVQPLDTTTITEDMATAMHLHAMGWTTVYHHEVLVHGLAPEDAQTMLSQRQRWAAGSMQVFFKDNPLFVPGLTIGQRLMYLGTMTSYLNGFAAIVYIAAPLVFLILGVFPLQAQPTTFFMLFIPFFLSCQLLFQVSANGSRGLWRGQQMSFALFPTWIQATLSGAAATFLGKHLKFSVTAKNRQGVTTGFRYVRPQLIAMAILVLAAVIGIGRAATGLAPLWPTLITLIWVVVDLALLAVVIGAARYPGPGETQEPALYSAGELTYVLDRAEATTPSEPTRITTA